MGVCVGEGRGEVAHCSERDTGSHGSLFMSPPCFCDVKVQPPQPRSEKDESLPPTAGAPAWAKWRVVARPLRSEVRERAEHQRPSTKLTPQASSSFDPSTTPTLMRQYTTRSTYRHEKNTFSARFSISAQLGLRVDIAYAFLFFYVREYDTMREETELEVRILTFVIFWG